jgi:hypothetical protein
MNPEQQKTSLGSFWRLALAFFSSSHSAMVCIVSLYLEIGSTQNGIQFQP